MSKLMKWCESGKYDSNQRFAARITPAQKK